MGFPCENPNFSPFRINLYAVEHSSVLRRFDNKLIQALTSFSTVVVVAREGRGLRQKNLVCFGGSAGGGGAVPGVRSGATACTARRLQVGVRRGVSERHMMLVRDVVRVRAVMQAHS